MIKPYLVWVGLTGGDCLLEVMEADVYDGLAGRPIHEEHIDIVTAADRVGVFFDFIAAGDDGFEFGEDFWFEDFLPS